MLPFHSCQETLSISLSPRVGLADQLLEKTDLIWFINGNSFVCDGHRMAGYSVVSLHGTVEAQPVPINTSSQLEELLAITQALELAKDQRATINTDSKYAFLVLRTHAAIWKDHQFLTSKNSPIKHNTQILKLRQWACLYLLYNSINL